MLQSAEGRIQLWNTNTHKHTDTQTRAYKVMIFVYHLHAQTQRQVCVYYLTCSRAKTLCRGCLLQSHWDELISQLSALIDSVCVCVQDQLLSVNIMLMIQFQTSSLFGDVLSSLAHISQIGSYYLRLIAIPTIWTWISWFHNEYEVHLADAYVQSHLQ